MIAELILGGAALTLYVLGGVISKEYVDYMEENDHDFLPRDRYWMFIMTWPYQVVVGLLGGDDDK